MDRAAPKSAWRIAPRTRRRLRQLILGLLFTSPWIVGLLVFNVYPTFASLFYSLTDYDLLQPPIFVGLRNYTTLFFHDPLFLTTLGNTIYFATISVLLGTILDIGIALLLATRVRSIGLFRTIFFAPSVVP